MNKYLINRVLNLILIVDLLCMIFTAVIMKWVLPPGCGGQGRRYRGGWNLLTEQAEAPVCDFWSLGRHDWGTMHFYLACAFLSLIVLHLVLHWGWIKSAYFKFQTSNSES